MIFSIATVADFDQFLKTFSTSGAEKRKEPGARGRGSSAIPTSPAGSWWSSIGDGGLREIDRGSGRSAIFQELGLRGPPVNVKAEPVGEYDS